MHESITSETESPCGAASESDWMLNAASLQPECEALPLTPGELLSDGRFVVQRELGRGGMGVVYEAIDRARGQRVALKIARRTGSHHAARLEREFCALAPLRHRNLVRTFGLHREADRCFLSMELIEGVTLQRVATRAPTELRRVFFQLAGGVDALHQSGHLHRDLKPSNVMVSTTGRVVVVDFGLISGRSSTRDDARLGAGCGTPRYRAPEQYVGKTPGPAADWYAVGIMLSERLIEGTQRPTLDPAALRAELGRRTDDKVPASLRTLCLGLLERDPANRPTSAQILAVLRAQPRRTQAAPRTQPLQAIPA